MSAPEIGVLLPVRLETRFVAPRARGRWRLRVRVVPDAVSIANHDELASTVELDAVEAMWRGAGGRGLETPEGRRAWDGLAAAVGAERAAWLARTFPPVRGSDGEIGIVRPRQTRTDMRAPRVLGLPPTLEVWIARAGGAPVQAATLSVLAEAVDLDLGDPGSTSQPWWTSFSEAVRVGLAAELDLGTARPDDIDVLYVVGVGGGDPGPLLAAQADSGRLGIVAAGSATSTVDGAPALPVGDADAWRRLVPVGAAAQEGTVAVSTALAGAPLAHGVVGGEHNHRPLNRAVVGAIWPALWGHSLANVWGYGTKADELGVWAAANLAPEGPLPSMRIEDQPYGLLPATSLRRWRAAAGDPEIEGRLVPLVRALVDAWAGAAERAAAQADGDPLRRLVRGPSATRYAWRWVMPTTLARALAFRFGQATPAADLGDWWSNRAAATPRLDPAADPARRLVAVGWAHDLELRLVEPDGRSLSRLAAAPVAELLAAGSEDGGGRSTPPGTSVLTELARHSLLAGAAAVARGAAGQARAVVEPVGADARSATETETWALRMQPADLRGRGTPAVAVRRNVVDGLKALAGEDPGDVARALRAALDTASHRLDPWATGIAWRRLQALSAAPRSLGAYGWVDAPRPRAAAGGHRYVLAPSGEQAAVAAVLRDRALRDPDADRWQMALTSDAIRAALRLAQETREGSHPAESLGRRVEAILKRPEVIDRVRGAFPSARRSGRLELRVRRVCDGAAVLEAAEARPAELTQLGVRTQQLAALTELAAAVDALADLHVVEATLGFVKRRSGAVSAARAAAAGLAPPPEFDVVRTPRSGRVVETVIAIALPDAPKPTGARPSPAALADPAVAAFVDDRAGDAAGPAWTWSKLDAAGAAAGTVTLADVGLRPCDTLGLGTGNLRDVVREVSGAAGLDAADPPGHATVRAAAAALDGIPAAPEDLGAPPDSAGTVAAELAGRYAALRTAATAAVADARNAAVPTATDRARRAALGRIARWGVTPLGGGDPALGDLAERVARAADVLERRLGEAPAAPDDATAPVLAANIAALVAAEGPWPVFGRLPAAAFDGMRAEPAAAGADARLDPDWLETVAPVRPAVSRLEAAQLEDRIAAGRQPLRAWTNRPGDPWQTVAPPPSDIAVVRPSRLVAAFGPEGVLPARPTGSTPGPVAVGVIDRFAESIPDTQQIVAVAFPHDLPTARAQQALVLAVPPVVDEALTPAVLVDIVAEVRALARTRMADAAQVGPAASALHLATMPASGRTGVGLGER